MNLTETIRESRRRRQILLMSHIVIGYPSLEESSRLIDAMVSAGVDLIELQIPFSEPIADGPVILRANQRALENGVRVEHCLKFAAEVSKRHRLPFLFMSYYNILVRRGVQRFCEEAAKAGVVGAIVPDCPAEEAGEYLASMHTQRLAPIFIFSPRTTEARLKLLGNAGEGFVYVVARKGVTGADTALSSELDQYLARCRAATELPLAVGFGLKSKADVDFLTGKADIAVVGSQSLRLMEERGVEAVGEFLKRLRD